MLRLYDNAFSPFARKVRMAMEYKNLQFEVYDGLRKSAHEKLAAANGRVEVPALDHDGVLVVNSADIIDYLDQVFPQKPVLPADAARRVHARAWERCCDTVIDAILIDISYWTWAERDDTMPAGLRDKAQTDLNRIYAALERDLASGPWLCGGEFSIADLALFPHLVSAKPLGVGFDSARHPRLAGWLGNMRALTICKADTERTKAYLAGTRGNDDIERRKIFWRGDRIEWMLASGQHQWFMREIEQGRVLWPGLGIPAARKSMQ